MVIDFINFESSFFPVNISKTFENLKSISIENCKEIFVIKSNFWGLNQLESLIFVECSLKQLQTGCFEDLKSLKTFIYQSSSLVFLDENSFDDLSSLVSLSLSYNAIRVSGSR